MANQYTIELLERYNPDYVIYMDADEFLISTSDRELKDVLNNLDISKIHTFKWRTYLYSGDNSDCFEPKTYRKYRSEENETFYKIIIPANLLREKEIMVSAGNHSISSPYIIEELYHDEVKFAHFPIRSLMQRKKQITINMLDMMSNPNEFMHTGSHWKELYRSESVNLLEESKHYAFYEGDIVVDGCPCIGEINRAYLNLVITDLESILLEHSELQALRIKKSQMKCNDQKCVPIIVWGTGKHADKMVDRISNKYFVELYVDSDFEKQFKIFHEKIVISPEKMRFFDFSKIIIASPQNENEIRKQIKEMMPFWDEKNIISIDTFIVNGYRDSYRHGE